MKKALYAVCCLLLVAGTGCALTDYADITDAYPPGSGGPINTQSKAHVIDPFQTAVNLGAGWFAHTWFVDQTAGGDRSIVTVFQGPTAIPTDVFHNDMYCNPDWGGCAAWAANDPPGGNGSCAFDGRWNIPCQGDHLYYLICYYTRYYGECGRDRLTTAEKIEFMNMGRLGTSMGMEGLFYDMSAKNFTIAVDNNAGVTATVPVRGNVPVFLSPQGGKATVDLTNPLLASSFRNWADYLAKFETGHMTATLTYNGITKVVNFATVGGASQVQKRINKYY